MPPKASADAKKASKGKAKTSAKGKGTLSTGDDSAHGGSELKAAIKVVVTGGAGQIAYSLLPILVSGSVFGSDQPVSIALLDIEPAMTAAAGVILELEDLREPLYAGALATPDAEEAFKDADVVVFLGAFPRKAGMERKDVMAKNVGIFNAQGAALAFAKPTVRCLVVGNPANTNAAVLARAAPSVPKENITCLTRLDHNRAASLLAAKAGVPCNAVDGVIVWVEGWWQAA